MCDQQRLRPACAYAQTDQSLCLSLEYSMTVELLTEHCLEFLSLTGGCTGSSESTLVKMSNCWKSRAAAHILFILQQVCTCKLTELMLRILHMCAIARFIDLIPVYKIIYRFIWRIITRSVEVLPLLGVYVCIWLL